MIDTRKTTDKAFRQHKAGAGEHAGGPAATIGCAPLRDNKRKMANKASRRRPRPRPRLLPAVLSKGYSRALISRAALLNAEIEAHRPELKLTKIRLESTRVDRQRQWVAPSFYSSSSISRSSGSRGYDDEYAANDSLYEDASFSSEGSESSNEGDDVIWRDGSFATHDSFTTQGSIEEDAEGGTRRSAFHGFKLSMRRRK